ncbi:MAG: hypothetical protein P4L85_01485 [Paludisphaera borealis]|uniref:hypothetical protein n=1 Tax=Paludisphaera borealis TaxID=1387353 RepID=UPI0028443382|nr:hypothetical protein [Paludisphaera borealis]MDR3617992.1 hypothetical protein [Paludisphaera borealis]
MRHPQLLVLALTLATASLAIAAEKPIPQDPAKTAKRSRERLEFQRRTLQGAYDKIGKRDPRWDKPAREALELAAQMFSLQIDPDVNVPDVNKPAKAAVNAGCDDPMVVYLYQRTLSGSDDPGLEETIRRAKSWSQGLADSKYPVFRRAIAVELAAEYLLSSKPLTDEIKKEAERGFDATLAMLPNSVAQDDRNEFWEDRWYDCLINLIRDYRGIGVQPVAAYERVDAALAKLPKLKALQLKVRGYFWFYFGWEARTKSFARNVPAGGFETLEACLEKSKQAMEEAWRLQPDDAGVATMLMDVDKAVGGDRETMEMWFDRAMKADGDHRTACWTKLDWLDPKWHGTDEEMLAFGRACRDTKNWRTGITLLVADAHNRHVEWFPIAEKTKYLASREVWSDIESVYTEYLKHFPDAAVARSKYASLAYNAGHFDVAHAQFEAVGDDLVQSDEFPFVPLQGLKRMRAHVAQWAASKPK